MGLAAVVMPTFRLEPLLKARSNPTNAGRYSDNIDLSWRPSDKAVSRNRW